LFDQGLTNGLGDGDDPVEFARSKCPPNNAPARQPIHRSALGDEGRDSQAERREKTETQRRVAMGMDDVESLGSNPGTKAQHVAPAGEIEPVRLCGRGALLPCDFGRSIEYAVNLMPTILQAARQEDHLHGPATRHVAVRSHLENLEPLLAIHRSGDCHIGCKA